MKKTNYEKPNIFGLFNNGATVFGEDVAPKSTPEIGDSEEGEELPDDPEE